MAIEARNPPSRLVAKLRRALGGRAGWGGFALQILFVATLAWIGYEIIGNARVHLASQHVAYGFGFLSNTAGVCVRPKPVSSSGYAHYYPVVFGGLSTTRLVAGVGLFFFT